MRRVAQLMALVGTVVLFTAGVGDASADQTTLAPLTQINGDVTDAGASSVAVNDAGQAVVGWSEILATNVSYPRVALAMVAFRNAAGTWSPPEQVSSAGQNASDVHVAIDAAGTATIAWTEALDFSNPAVRTVRHTDAGYLGAQTFAAPVGGAHRLDLAANAAGDAVLTWTGSTSCDFGCGGETSTGHIYGATRTAGGDFGPAQELSDPATLYRSGAVASVGAHGDIAVAWEEGVSTAIHVRVRQEPHGGAFAPARDLTTTDAASTVPNVVVTPSGTATVTWWESKAMHASRLGVDGTVASTQTLPGTYNDVFAQGPAALAVDDAGSVTAAWVTNDGLWTADGGPGADLGSAVMLDRDATANGTMPALAKEAGGGTLLAWMNNAAMKATWRLAGASSFPSATTIQGGAYSTAPQVALAARHALLTAWFGAQGSQSSLFAAVGNVVPTATTPPPAPKAPQADTTPPQLRITAASVVKAKSKKRSGKNAVARQLQIVVSASEPAQVVAKVTRRSTGVRRGQKCVPVPTHKSSGHTKARSCTRSIAIGTPLRFSVAAGPTTLPLGSAPPNGSYDIVLTASDAAGNQALPASRHLVIR